MRGYFVTGTDTGVGKTQIACALIRHLAGQGLRVAGFKPLASGCPQGMRHDDALALMAAANVALDYDLVNPYAFEPAIAPHWAARMAGIEIDIHDLVARTTLISTQVDQLVVEGAGGFLVPINARASFADLAAALGLPVLLVVGLRLGAINHALLTAEAIGQRGLRLVGWVGNHLDAGPIPAGTLETLHERIAAPCLGVCPWTPVAEPWRALGPFLSVSAYAPDARQTASSGRRHRPAAGG